MELVRGDTLPDTALLAELRQFSRICVRVTASRGLQLDAAAAGCRPHMLVLVVAVDGRELARRTVPSVATSAYERALEGVGATVQPPTGWAVLTLQLCEQRFLGPTELIGQCEIAAAELQDQMLHDEWRELARRGRRERAAASAAEAAEAVATAEDGAWLRVQCMWTNYLALRRTCLYLAAVGRGPTEASMRYI